NPQHDCITLDRTLRAPVRIRERPQLCPPGSRRIVKAARLRDPIERALTGSRRLKRVAGAQLAPWSNANNANKDEEWSLRELFHVKHIYVHRRNYHKDERHFCSMVRA